MCERMAVDLHLERTSLKSYITRSCVSHHTTSSSITTHHLIRMLSNVILEVNTVLRTRYFGSNNKRPSYSMLLHWASIRPELNKTKAWWSDCEVRGTMTRALRFAIAAIVLWAQSPLGAGFQKYICSHNFSDSYFTL